MKVLNLYAGIGGNRKLWEDVEVTAVELDPEVAKVYQDHFPDDTVVVADAHQYLINHFQDFDFIWTSRSCKTHSRGRFWRWSKEQPVYPDFGLYEEIVFLQHHAECKWVAENVVPYYPPLIPGKQIGRHLFWSNFTIGNLQIEERFHEDENRSLAKEYGFHVEGDIRKEAIRNMVHPEIGKYILDRARGIIQKSNTKQMSLI